MSAARAFLADELKRAVPPALTLASVPCLAWAAHSVQRGTWPETGPAEWSFFLPYLFAYVLGPLAGAGLASVAWGIDRWRGSESWVYARPLGTGTLFILRSLVVIGSIGLTLLFGLHFLADAGNTHALLVRLSAIGALILAVGLGSFVSSSSSAPLTSFAAGSSVGIGLLSLFGLLVAWVPASRSSFGWVRQVSLAFTAFALLAGTGLLAATWLRIRKAPADGSTHKEGLVAAAAGTILAAAAAAFVLAAASGPSSQTDAVKRLGQGAELRMVTAVSGLYKHRTHAVIARPGGREIVVVVEDFSPWSGLTFAFGWSGEVLVRDKNDPYRWALLDRYGNQDTFDLSEYVPRRRRPDPLGWSPNVSAFAWTNQGRGAPSQLVVLGPERELSAHQLDLPNGIEWRGAWLDGDSLLIAPLPTELRSEPRKTDVAPWYAIVNVDGTVEQPVTFLGNDSWVSLPALEADVSSDRVSRIPRLGKQPVVWLERRGARATLHALSLSTHELEPLSLAEGLQPEDAGSAFPTESSLTSLADRSLLWLEWRLPRRNQNLLRVVRLHATGRFEEPCTFDRTDQPEPVAFLGRSGDWVLFEGSAQRSIHACNLETGQVAALNGIETRRIDFENGELVTPDGRIALAELPATAKPSNDKFTRKP